MERIPIYARGGAVIPMWPEAPQSTSGYQPVVMELHLFVPASDGVSSLDAAGGRRPDLCRLEGARYRTTFTVERAGTELTAQSRGERRRLPGIRAGAFRAGAARRGARMRPHWTMS